MEAGLRRTGGKFSTNTMSIIRRLWNCLCNKFAVSDWFVANMSPFYTLEMVMLVRAMNLAAELDIADKLNGNEMTVEQLAAETGTLAEPLHRVLRALAAFGYFRETRPGVFACTKKSSVLQSGTSDSLKDWILFATSEETTRAYNQSLNVVKEGNGGFQLAHGKQMYDLLYNDPSHEKTRDVFVRGMGKFTEWQSRIVAKTYDFKNVKKVVDIAGGHGFLISRILQMHPHLSGAMVDQPYAIEQATKTANECGVADRCKLTAGDIFDASTLPNDGDLYTIKHVLWDWDDTDALKILKNIKLAMPTNSQLLIIENVISSDNDTDGLGKLFDLEQMFNYYGKSRTKDEWINLTEKAGFKLERIQSTECFDVKLLTFNPVGVQ